MHPALFLIPFFLIAGCAKPPASVNPISQHPANSYRVTEGETRHAMTVDRVTDTFFTGSSDKYSAINVTRHPNHAGWMLIVYDLKNPTSQMYPSANFLQVIPDDNHPLGKYTAQNTDGPNSHPSFYVTAKPD